ncbi:MAG: hypothetical protein ACRD3B_02350 [Candidatus Sulfotelmatobacter sp.]
MPSKRQLSTSQRVKLRKNRYFLDRNLGSVFLPKQLRQAGVDITVHDDVYQTTERDPWIFYDQGQKGFIVVTSDTAFMKSFPHMAAVALARTIVLAFSNNNYKSDIRGNAFLKALSRIEKEISRHRRHRKRKYFIAVIGMAGTFTIKAESPLPHRKTCDPKDWESYERVCQTEGVLALRPSH